jgi:hypothetical protein
MRHRKGFEEVMMKNKWKPIILFFSAISLGWANLGLAADLFQEGFEDGNFSSRGWYDNTNPKLSSVEHVANSTKSLECHFAKGAITPDNGTTMRKKFQATDSVYIRYYIKHSSNWVGSGQAYQPHEFYLLTNKDGDWSGLIPTHMTAYVEENGGKPQVGIQDALSIDNSNIGKNLTTVTEKRAIAGCNGDSDGYGNGDCYANGSQYWNGKWWKSSNTLFSNTAGPYYKGDWHLVEVFVKLNSIVNGIGVKDGILQFWFDGNPVMNYSNVVFRSGLYPDMKFNQLIIGPYIGDGSPVDQTFWVDDLVVATGRPGDTASSQPSPPQNLRVISQ